MSSSYTPESGWWIITHYWLPVVAAFIILAAIDMLLEWKDKRKAAMNVAKAKTYQQDERN